MKIRCSFLFGIGLLFTFSVNSTKYTCQMEDGTIIYDSSESLPLQINYKEKTSSFKNVEVTTSAMFKGMTISTEIARHPYVKVLTWVIPHFTPHPSLNLNFGSLVYETTYTNDKIVQHEIKAIPVTNCQIVQ